jgi:hypothetical protein
VPDAFTRTTGNEFDEPIDDLAAGASSSDQHDLQADFAAPIDARPEALAPVIEALAGA